jgi:tRNA pseudouridine38-40 synthase
MPTSWTAERLRSGVNALVAADVWLESVSRTAGDFHPRYDALRRTYRYEVGIRAHCASPFHRRWCWPLGEALDRDLLDRAADAVVGEHSFQAFAKTGQPERGHRCRVGSAGWSDTPLGVRFTISADRYLHHMVRYLVGSMVDIARGRRPLDDMARLLRGDPGVVMSPPAPSEGLFLHRVEYPGDDAPESTVSENTSPRSATPA